MVTRGTIVLALVRALSIRRPIELYICISLDANKTHDGQKLSEPGGAYLACRIDTAPLDLTRAAHYLSHPSITRYLGYSTLRTVNGATGMWQYCSKAGLQADVFTDVCRQAFPQYTDILAIPAMHRDDPLRADPLKWLQEKINLYASDEQRAA